MDEKNNHLFSEKSPYLQQHAYNPVDWYPWDDEAFKKASAEDKPIFLSIGYSTCHWCHVMEKESFEDIAVAKIMNETFVCIKVDREERPDIDKVYMNFCQAMTGSGGWPLSIIMTPEKKPFFAATYIPRQNQYGRIGMLELIPKIKELWTNSRSDIMQTSENLSNILKQQSFSIADKPLDEAVFDMTFEHLSQLFDFSNGGFGASPKFPTMHRIFFLLRYFSRTKNEYALKMVEKTISNMKSGGIWDHIGFGFHRYSTDEKWIMPHFEKMLYDQALNSIGCIEAFLATGNSFYKNISEEIFTYVLRDLTSGSGGFYSAEDADSEGVEGKFYSWTKDEINELFIENESEILADVFNIGVNTLETGSVLYINSPFEDIAYKHNLSLKDLKKFIQSAIKKMFYVRQKRIHPFKDDKILTDWNGLMIAALAFGARVFEKKEYEKAAIKAAGFIIDNLVSKEGLLLHRYRDGQAAISGNLDDYSFFTMGLLELYETTFNTLYLKTALNLNKYLIDNFWDGKNGGFYFTQKNNELADFMQKDIYDGATPSGNSIELLNLIKLSRITGNVDLENKALELLKSFSEIIGKSPESYTQFLSSFDFILGPSYEIVIVGDLHCESAKKILRAINNVFIPNKVVVFKTTEILEPEITSLAYYTRDMNMINNKPTIYVCSEYKCSIPTNDINKMLELLGKPFLNN